MADQPTGKALTARVSQPRGRVNPGNVKGAYCNFFTARANSEEIILNFGFNDRGGSAPKSSSQAQILHRVVLGPGTARRLRDTLSAMLGKKDAPRVVVKAQVAPRKAPG